MRLILTGVCLVVLLATARANDDVPEEFSSLVESGLTALVEMDNAELRNVCRNLQEQMRGQSVIDLAAVRDVAHAILPALEDCEETRPTAAWLRARLDELDVAEELRTKGPVSFQPSPVVVRKAWQNFVAREPVSTTIAVLVARLKPVFRAERVPVELVWLAEVESGFDPRAQSPVGAAGLFQLMPDTAKFLDLPASQRYEVLPSARAAAKYLRYLAGKFHDWRLALAAYNAGEGRVRRLLDKSAAKTYDAIAVQLPAETQLYVPRIEAVIQRREGVALTELNRQGR